MFIRNYYFFVCLILCLFVNLEGNLRLKRQWDWDDQTPRTPIPTPTTRRTTTTSTTPRTTTSTTPRTTSTTPRTTTSTTLRTTTSNGKFTAKPPSTCTPTSPQDVYCLDNQRVIPECIRYCLAQIIDQYNPVCGTDGCNYRNSGRLNCVVSCCKKEINVDYNGVC